MTQEATPARVGQYYYGTGRRKEAVARVRLYAGSGNIEINGKPYLTLFTRNLHQIKIRRPLEITDLAGKFDVVARINGGGMSGWADALSHGISRAILAHDESFRTSDASLSELSNSRSGSLSNERARNGSDVAVLASVADVRAEQLVDRRAGDVVVPRPAGARGDASTQMIGEERDGDEHDDHEGEPRGHSSYPPIRRAGRNRPLAPGESAYSNSLTTLGRVKGP